MRRVGVAVGCIAVMGLSLPPLAGEAVHSVPKAVCGPQDRTESVQGQATLAERFNPGPAKSFNCNLELVSQFKGEGASADMRVFANCAYYPTAQNNDVLHPGVVVLDLSDSTRPRVTAYLESQAMLNAYESLEFDSKRQLLLGSRAPDLFDIYDVSSDCRHPVLKKSFSITSSFYHSGKFSPDGLTFYGAKFPPDPDNPPASAVFAFDASVPEHLRIIATWLPPRKEWVPHSVSVSKDGARAYVVISRIEDDQARSAHRDGLVILDISGIQARQPGARFRLVSTLFWDDAHFGEYALPTRIHGRSYLISTDLSGAIPLGTGAVASTDACRLHKPTFGFARIVDISDESHPKVASRLILEVSDPTNCQSVAHDPVIVWGYGSWACNTDNDNDARLLACGYFEGGLRVFDIRDPLHPKEIAYYKPPARGTESHAGSLLHVAGRPDADHTTDFVICPVFRKNAEEIWFNSFDNGVQVVRFSAHFKQSRPDLFAPWVPEPGAESARKTKEGAS